MATKFGTAAAFLLIGLCASAHGFWDGNAALQRGDPSLEKGSFAASNSFPVGTKIVVENLLTGNTTEVTVSKRAGEQSDLLVLLSPKAAAALDIPPGQVAAVRVTLKSASAQAEPAAEEDVLSRDPDINPAAGVAAVPRQNARPEAEREGTLESLSGAAVSGPSETPVPQEPSITPQAPSAEEELLKRMASRRPQKQLFLPPREDEKFVYQPPIEPPAEAATISSLKGQKPPAEKGREPAVAVAEPQQPKQETPKPEVNAAAARAPSEGSRTIVALEPAAPKPPTETPAPEKKPAPKPSPAPAAALTGTKAVYFLQLGAYTNESQAKELATGLSSSYPVSVSAPQASGSRYYRVLLGPLNKAESGTLLYWFRDRGFPDAFIRRE